jgi:hypothetical protein
MILHWLKTWIYTTVINGHVVTLTAEKKIGSIIVTKNDRKPFGIIKERDLARGTTQPKAHHHDHGIGKPIYIGHCF